MWVVSVHRIAGVIHDARGQWHCGLCNQLQDAAPNDAQTTIATIAAELCRVDAAVHRSVRAGIALLLCIGVPSCQLPARVEPVAPSHQVDFTAFRNCVDREAKLAVQRAIDKATDADARALTLYGYHTEINNQVIFVCDPGLKPMTLTDSIYTRNAEYLYVISSVDAQQESETSKIAKQKSEEEKHKTEMDAPRLRFEKSEEDRASKNYYMCLARNAKTLALNSNEPAEIIVQASFPSCANERQILLDLLKLHKGYADLELVNSMEAVFRPNLLLEVIKARTQPPAPSQRKPEASPSKPEEPI
jgi:hypothetical protein